MAAVSENAPRLSFNPSWMGSTYASSVPSSVSMGRSVSTEEGPDTGGTGKNYPLAPPKLAKNSYGREELLALFQAETSWDAPPILEERFPDFYLDECRDPVTVSSFTEIEEKLISMGINSSKAMSAMSHVERGPPGGTGTGGGFHNTRWQQEERFGGDSVLPPPRPGYGRGRGFAGPGFSYRGRGGGTAGVGSGNGGPASENGRFGGPPGLGRGRGTVPPASPGRGSAAPSFNSRAQGLYDPRDPRDRPRQRLRSTGEGSGGATYSAPGAGRGNWPNRDDIPAWAGDEDDEEEEEANWGFGEDGQFGRDKTRDHQKKSGESGGREDEKDPGPTKESNGNHGERAELSRDRERVKPRCMEKGESEKGKPEEHENSWLKGKPEIAAKPDETPSALRAIFQQQAQAPGQQQRPQNPPPFLAHIGGESRKRLADLVSKSSGQNQEHAEKPSSVTPVEQDFEKIHSDVESLVQSFSEEDTAMAIKRVTGIGSQITQGFQQPQSSMLSQQSQPISRAVSGAEHLPSSASNVTGTPPTHPSAQAPPSAPGPWYYLDPRKQVQGPFPASQMAQWFTAGYFDMTLMVRRQTDQDFVYLSDLIKRYGGIPFSMEIGAGAPGPATSSTAKAASVQPQRMPSSLQPQSLYGSSSQHHSQSSSTINAAAQHSRVSAAPQQPPQSVWGDVSDSKINNDAAQIALEKLAQIQKQQMEEKLKLEAEQRRIQELEAKFKKEREEKEAREREFQKQQEAMKLLQEELARQRQKDELERRRLEEEVRRKEAEEQERQRREEEAKREVEAQERRVRDEAERKVREEQQKKMQQMSERAAAEHAEMQRRVQAERMRKEEAERAERERQELSSGHRISIQDLLRVSGQVASATQWGAVPETQQQQQAGAWNRPTVHAGAPVQPPPTGSTKSLLEIQQEEERQLRAEKKQHAELERERKAIFQNMNVGSEGAWGGGNKPLRWEQQQPPAGRNAATAWGGVGATMAPSQGFWDTEPSPVVNMENSKPNKKQTSQSNSSQRGSSNSQQQQQSQNKGKGKKKNAPSSSIDSNQDPLLSWMIKEIESLNSDVDSTTFATFLLNVESPSEVEEFVFGYFGDSKPAKEFHQNFLQKRSEQRNSSRKKATDRDDLSAPAAALGTVSSAGGASGPQAGAAAGKKKKKGSRKVVDGRVLGFTAAADSTRLNIGEIEVPE